jgi:hypothetical protein
VHQAGYQVSGEIHREGYKQNSRQRYQQGGINADSNFSTRDFFEYPHNQPNQSQQDCRADDYEAAIGHGSPNWIGYSIVTRLVQKA